ncbi:Scr1 family TA system antitoxin-like transcriptional regulator [Actinomadura harenae]|uniref:Scr1 family TA system antitoxin-like transcriptional regulator n=1 Tax=Actinomadura harenae TaxID=2483351 RepID=UPI002279AB41|nr:Scr1 family TA system antitoxin-like transcriptional regulator [Actinomadura harenae]
MVGPESGADTIRCFDMVVPDLLQTAEYTRALRRARGREPVNGGARRPVQAVVRDEVQDRDHQQAGRLVRVDEVAGGGIVPDPLVVAHVGA